MMTVTPARQSSKSGFSLVEIVIALGIIAFALVSMVALLSGLVTTEGGIITNTSLPQITTHVLHVVKMERAGKAAETLPDNYTFHFTNEGARVNDPSQAAYSCLVTILPATISDVGDPGLFASVVRMDVQKPDASVVLKTVHATILNE